ncbi:MAG TPA: Crp/Fnr family transcriptional regulator [Gammaproteobacteria bacterium]|nr:Crp/Fnr family transcriptional regulator [Gammaproteobacteria bacterium]
MRDSARTDTKSWFDVAGIDPSAERLLDPGDVVFRQGAPASAVYWVRAGRIRLTRYLQDGSSVVLHVARANGTFAEASLFSDVYHCDAVAEIASVVTPVPKSDLLRALRQDLSGCFDLARSLAGQVRELRTRLEVRNIRSAPARVLAWLRLRATGNPPSVETDRPWTEVATEIGLTHESVYRALAELQRTGKLTREKGRLILKGSPVGD